MQVFLYIGGEEAEVHDLVDTGTADISEADKGSHVGYFAFCECFGVLLNLKPEVTKRTRGENENIYLNRRIEIDVNDGEPARDAKGDLIPF